MEVVRGYELEARIGEGAFASVWRARRYGLKPCDVAVKRASARTGPAGEAARDRLRAEATVLTELDHPHIVHVLDVVEDGAGVAIVMQLADGGSLRAMLDECGTLAAGEVVAVAAPVAEALASTHERGFVHGDVKPANILFTGEGEPLLSDFGAARHLAASVTSTAPVAGTAPYVDPELLDGGSASPINDVYALGVVCYEALVGALPYEGTVDEIVRAADRGVHRSLRAVRSVPRALADLVERAISRNPLERPASASDFAAALRASVDLASVRLPGVIPRVSGPHAATTSTSTRHRTQLFGPRPPKPHATAQQPDRRRRTVPLAIVAAVVAALVGLVALISWTRNHEQPASSRATARPRRASACPVFPRLSVSHGEQRFTVDLNGDGCRVPVAWDGQVMAARFQPNERVPRYYAIGARGDVLLFGDWNCDRAASPALYRPTDGSVIYVNAFAEHVGDRSYAARITRRLPRHGTPRVEREQHGCDVVRIGRVRR